MQRDGWTIGTPEIDPKPDMLAHAKIDETDRNPSEVGLNSQSRQIHMEQA
jgi:hypothetical protein